MLRGVKTGYYIFFCLITIKSLVSLYILKPKFLENYSFTIIKESSFYKNKCTLKMKYHVTPLCIQGFQGESLPTYIKRQETLAKNLYQVTMYVAVFSESMICYAYKEINKVPIK